MATVAVAPGAITVRANAPHPIATSRQSNTSPAGATAAGPALRNRTNQKMPSFSTQLRTASRRGVGLGRGVGALLGDGDAAGAAVGAGLGAGDAAGVGLAAGVGAAAMAPAVQHV